MNKQQPLISVIVPVYNTREYLDTCISSIVNQTYENLEIILVDDGANDDSGCLCERWAKKDSRTIVIHKKNGGLSDARNIGTVLAKGNYISYIDSDDLICQDMYSHMVALAKELDADVVDCSFQKFDKIPFESFEVEDEGIIQLDTEEAVKELLNDNFLKCTACNKIVKAKVAVKTPFDVGVINEDVLWSYRVFKKSRITVHTNKKLYAYYQRPDSIMHLSYSKKRFDGLDALQKRAEEIYKDFPFLYPRAERAYIDSCMYNYQYLCRLEKTEQYEEFKKILHKRFMDGDRKAAFTDIRLKYKIWYAMFARMPEFTCWLRNRFEIGL